MSTQVTLHSMACVKVNTLKCNSMTSIIKVIFTKSIICSNQSVRMNECQCMSSRECL